MQIKEATVKRFEAICKKENIKYNELANRSGVTPSTIYGMIKSKSTTISTIKKLCDGLEISVIEFFDDDIFKNLEQEIK